MREVILQAEAANITVQTLYGGVWVDDIFVESRSLDPLISLLIKAKEELDP